VKRSLLLFLIPFTVFMYLTTTLFFDSCHYQVGAEPQKKIPFNHKTHLTDYGTECNACHGYYENGRFKGIPTVAACLDCHPEGDRVNDQYLKALKPSDRPWDSYAKQSDLVYFSHKAVMTAQFEDGRLKSRCASCHGDKDDSVDGQKIKGKMLMGQCMDCHTALNISNACAVCHD